MFNVLIAEHHTFELIERYRMFLAPLLNEEIALCDWNPQGTTLEEMVPDLYSLIERKEAWRAVVLYDGHRKQRNPFDYTGFKPQKDVKQRASGERLYQNLQETYACFEKAAGNPLTRLTAALCGAPLSDLKETDDELFASVSNGEKSVLAYMLIQQLAQFDRHVLAAHLNKFSRDKLMIFAKSEENIDLLISCIADCDVSRICEMIPEERLIDFIKLIGEDDPMFSDPEYSLCKLQNTKKAQLFGEMQEAYFFRDLQPSEVLCVAPRTFDYQIADRNDIWEDKDEADYSRFAEFNMYPPQLRYLVFDLLAENDKRYMADEIRLLCLLLLLAGKADASRLMAAHRLYRVNIDFAPNAIDTFCRDYLDKLQATILKIQKMDCDLIEAGLGRIDNKTAEVLFESNTRVPVLISEEHDRSKLFAKYDWVGLAADCPQEELPIWEAQYRKIQKGLVRYFREPRRAVKRAATEDFHQNNTVKDERVLLLSDDQKENVAYKLQDNEMEMMETTTVSLFNMKKYQDEISEASQEIKKEIKKRMTRKKTVLVGLISLAAVLLGFLPLLFGNLNTTGSFLCSLIFLLVCAGAVGVCGYVYLFRFKDQLKSKIKGFNQSMHQVLTDVDNSLAGFSDYLSAACNVMRNFSVLNYPDQEYQKKRHILLKHKEDIENKAAEIMDVFGTFIDPECKVLGEADPFEYDFLVPQTYDYNMVWPHVDERVDFMQQGNETVLPVNYVKSISLVRENLYD